MSQTMMDLLSDNIPGPIQVENVTDLTKMGFILNILIHTLENSLWRKLSQNMLSIFVQKS